ncbi:hypothetical protein J437_LFUL005751 [Ladona fulva]|uniref:BZIP domain-containing protein n=1 Tax=Ladona fulva TaxID=123851 RepID=A0A8K0K312_LADFU|nr:hypothetical protein J437_LFUL005751 [Ladona fulva]
MCLNCLTSTGHNSSVPLHKLDSVNVLRQRIMVADFVARQSGSPINGETPSVQPLNSTMLSSQSNPPTGPFGENGMLPSVTPAASPAPSPNPDSSDHSEMMYTSESNFPGDPGYQGGSSQNNFDLSGHLKRKELFSQRKQREFIPDNKKDESYWDRRRRNNEAAKRSREKRRFNDMILEQRVVDLTKENHLLKAQLQAIKEKYGVSGETLISMEQVMATLPTNDQVLSITKRSKIMAPAMITMNGHNNAANPSAPLLPPPTTTGPVHRPVMVGTPGHYPSQPCPSPPMQPRSQVMPSSTPNPIPTPVIHEPIGAEANKYKNDLSPNPYAEATALGFTDQEVYPYHHYSHLIPPLIQQSLPHHAHPSVFNSPASLASMASPIVRPTSPPVINIGSPSGQEYEENNSVLNLSRSRTESPHSAVTPHELSSGDEGSPVMYAGSNLPHKLRHKSHLGDKDAASALLSLQNIKQEPRASPPWDTEGSSDERDSGISLGSEWHGNGTGDGAGRTESTTSIAARKRTRHSTEESERTVTPPSENLQRENSVLKSELAKLVSEVASIKSILARKET